jgi:hypothetical protein
MKQEVKLQHVEITAFTNGGEETKREKIDPKKRHSKNNTIIGWNVYENGKYKATLWK